MRDIDWIDHDYKNGIEIMIDPMCTLVVVIDPHSCW